MIPITDAIDLHVHAAPELFVRRGDALDMAERAKAAGMAGVLLKAHHENTMSQALLAERLVTGINVFGSITLNHYVGGFNPFAVGAALEMGAKAVFMPTFHSKEHIGEFGVGTYGIASMTVAGHLAVDSRSGLSVLNDEGNLLPEVIDIIKLIESKNAFLATAHLSTNEIEAVVEECGRLGARCLITHAYHVPVGDPEFYQRMARKGAYVELAANIAYPIAWHQGHAMTLEQAKHLIETIGSDRLVISTDAGQQFAPWPADTLEAFVNSMAHIGVDEDSLHQMIAVTPLEVLGLERPDLNRTVQLREE